MSEGSVSERRIHPIQDAAASGNWKQALQLCDKWAKKGEKSDQFLALKATVLLKQPDNAQHERGKQEVVQLCSRDPAITNVDALQQIQDALRDLSLHKQEGPKLWERAVAKSPQNKDLLTTWLHSSIAESNWFGAQKAAVALRKAFPKERKYEFWKTLFSYLIQMDPAADEKQRKLFGTLAYRFISKAAEMVPQDKDQLLSSSEALQTPEELSLLVNIYVNTGRAAEAVTLLSTQSLGLSSRFAAEDPSMVLRLLIRSYENAQMWHGAFDFCERRLDAKEAPDPALWELMLIALRESHNREELAERVLATARKLMIESPEDRSGFLSTFNMAVAGHVTSLELSDACQQYYRHFKARAFCFEDLRMPVSLLGSRERDTFFEGVARDETVEDPYERLLSFKLDYCFRLGLQATREDMGHLVKAALDLYDSCRKKSKACPEAGFLAAVALVKIARMEDLAQDDSKSAQHEVLLQLAMLLESCQKDQKHGEEYYPYLILLIRVQQMLGLTCMAMMNFKKLNVKNIQFESVGYFLLSRISTMHPRQFGKISPQEDSSYSPLEQLDLGLDMLEKAELTLTRQIDVGLDHGSYSNIVEAIQMRSNLQRSINREIFAYEHLKTRRLTGLLDEGGHPIPEYPLVDQRDFSFLQSYEVSGQSPLEYLQLGPLPRERWLSAMSLYDKVFFYLRSEMQGQSGTVERAFSLLKAAVQILDETSNDDLDRELTEEEAANLAIHRVIAKIILQSRDSNDSKQMQSNEYLGQLESWLEAKSTELQSGCVTTRGISLPTWKHLHASFTSLETLQGVSLLLSVAGKKTTKLSKALAVLKETITKLHVFVADAEAAVHKQAKRVKDTLNEAGVLGKLVEIVTGRSEGEEQQSSIGVAIEKQGDAARLETFCGEMKESWEDALDGVLACKIKVFK